jgi:hypothetical protein
MIQALRFKSEAISIFFSIYIFFHIFFRFELRKRYTAETPERAHVTYG